MDLRQLRFLVAVDDEGGVRAAARRLHTSQPQISRAIRELEREMGVELLFRSRGGVELSPAGRELVLRGREILHHVRSAQAAMRRLGEQHSTTLRIGVTAGVLSAGELLAPILDAYRRSDADVAVEVIDLGLRDQVTPLLRGDVDAAIVRPPLRHADVVVEPIAEEGRVLMVGASHELAREDSVDVQDILHLRTVALGCRPEFSDFWELNAERGHPNRAPDLAPATTVAEAQLAVVSREVLISAGGVTGRLHPNPLVAHVHLRGVAPSVIGIARLRRDARGAVRRFVESAQATAERHIALLPGGALPTG